MKNSKKVHFLKKKLEKVKKKAKKLKKSPKNRFFCKKFNLLILHIYKYANKLLRFGL